MSKIENPDAETTMILDSCIFSLDCAELKATGIIDDKDEEDYPIECICEKCHGKFNEIDLVTIQYAEYPGASMQEEYASPCCHSEWDYVDEE
jgi:hypothetical protein